MRALVLMAALVFFSDDALGVERVCFERNVIDIKELHPPVRIREEFERESKIVVDVRVECGSGEVMPPASLQEAVDYVDKALPLDFKVGLVSGDYMNPYLHTSYGASVVSDVDDFFTDVWGLDGRSLVCRGVRSSVLIESGGCFYIILDKFRSLYLGELKGD